MSPQKVIRRFKEVFAAVAAREDSFADEAALRSFADLAYADCVTWFGAPTDPQKPYKIQQEPSSGVGSRCDESRECYEITISDAHTTIAQRCEVVAHEMCHRVIMRRPGLGKDLWVSEMLACTAARWVLRRRGFAEHAAFLAECQKPPKKINVSKLREARRPRGFHVVLRGEQAYPENFYTSVYCLGVALQGMVGWKHLAAMVSAKSLDEWVFALRPELDFPTRHLLALPHRTKELDSDTRYLFGRAPYCIGNLDNAILELERVVYEQPNHVEAYKLLGSTWQCLGKNDAAIIALQKASELDLSDARVPFDLGSITREQGDLLASIEWYRESLRRHSGWAGTFYSLGCVLKENGNFDEARTVWATVLTLGDDDCTKAAVEAIAEVNADKGGDH